MNQTTIDVLNRINTLPDLELSALVSEVFYKNSSDLYPDNSRLKALTTELAASHNMRIDYALTLVTKQIMEAAAFRFSERATGAQNTPFTLTDDVTGETYDGVVQRNAFNISIGIKGFNGVESDDDVNSLVVVEPYEGKMRLRLYEDGSTESPTQFLDMSGAVSNFEEEA